MAIVATAKILQDAKRAEVDTRSADRRVRRDGQSAARSAASLLARLEAPRYSDLPEEWEDAVEGFDPERLVLVFTNEPPIILGTPSFESVTGWRPRGDNEPWGVPMGYDEEIIGSTTRKRRYKFDLAGEQFIDVDYKAPAMPARLSPILAPDECAAAAFRALMADTREHGPAVEWDVQVWSDEKHTWELRRYIGTESALRQNFPDWETQERMRACGVQGIPVYAPAPGQHYPAPGPIELQGHEAPAVPYRIRRRYISPSSL